MDESVQLFEEEQKRTNEARSFAAYVLRDIMNNFLVLMLVSVSLWGLLQVLGSLPRNADNSLQVAFYGPVLGALAVIAASILKIRKPEAAAIRWTCWFYIVLAVIGISVGILDLVSRNVG